MHVWWQRWDLVYLDTTGRVWEDPLSLRGKGSFEQTCVALACASHFFREVKFSDVAK